MIPLSAPDIDARDIAAVVDVLRTPCLSLGPKLVEFERAVADYTGVEHAVALSSGTAGLHLGLLALGLGAGDEVIIPSFTFIATANAVRYVGATPVFADIDPVSLNLDPDSVARAITPRTRAILAVHTFGRAADLDALGALAARHGLYLIEDSCEALGAEHRGRRAGSVGVFGVYGFYPNKPITTGEGGMLVTHDARMAALVRALRNQGRWPDDGWTDHRLLGYNYRLADINCALGLAQMQRIDAILARRADRAACYARHLSGVQGLLAPPLAVDEGRLCWFVYVVRLADRYSATDRDAVMHRLTARGIGCGRYFAPLHWQPLYASYIRPEMSLVVTEQVAPRVIALPFYNRLTDHEIETVCQALREALPQ